MKGAPAVVARLRAVARADVALPQPVVAEIAYGIERLPRSKRREALADRFELIRGELGRSVWTDSISERFASIKATLERRGERIEDFDAVVAAHALAESAVLVTANLRRMARIAGLKVEDWAREH
jgi:tRNA(fMet)-specific endonuclease VapC